MLHFQAAQWISQSRCPNCEREAFRGLGRISISFYTFGRLRIALPPSGIEFRECGTCGLVFKDFIPSVEFLSEVMNMEAGDVWSDPYSHQDDVALILSVSGRADLDILDVGASHGFLLKALAPYTSGRLSALDLVAYSGLRSALRGEFISGLLESDSFDWSNKPYDVVTAFDVFEHFYRPAKAFSQVKNFLKPGGLLILETGDRASSWPSKFGMNRWWYAAWFVHHIFWNEQSLARAAKVAGFSVERVIRRKHKSRRNMGHVPLMKEALKVGLYKFSPSLYQWISGKANSSGIQPYSPWTEDHLFMVFRKV